MVSYGTRASGTRDYPCTHLSRARLRPNRSRWRGAMALVLAGAPRSTIADEVNMGLYDPFATWSGTIRPHAVPGLATCLQQHRLCRDGTPIPVSRLDVEA